jgi:hypothetical protein
MRPASPSPSPPVEPVELPSPLLSASLLVPVELLVDELSLPLVCVAVRVSEGGSDSSGPPHVAANAAANTTIMLERGTTSASHGVRANVDGPLAVLL